MFGRKPRWLRHGGNLICLDRVDDFARVENDVRVFFHNDPNYTVLSDITLDDIHYFLKHGRPRKRKA